MTIKLCVVMDPINSIKTKKDTTFALMLEAQKRHWEIYYLEASQLFLADNQVNAIASKIRVKDSPVDFVEFLDEPRTTLLSEFDIVLMRKDPPFDVAYLYATYLLELAEREGCLILNRPRSIRDANEKLFTTWFSQCCPETLVTSQIHLVKQFIEKHHKIIIKPLHSMGGQGVLMANEGDLNLHAMVELLTHRGKYPIMAQRYISQISQSGDKRILLIDGEPYPYALARIPSKEDFRGNLASGAQGIKHELTARDRWLCEQVGPTLKEKGLFFVGLDVIGDFITEINVTSPTGVREVENLFNINIACVILDKLEKKIKS
ncbi:glutathione synthase [Candidatus Berkiella aquae]|uniref:Glutathione synthetase n=1 Tax=Candidatus Berkiella aquae TaxID=295108 RepID=A0A0Q9YKN6_9GAMM|nr:glutathione synthase [Candidatus Berkiella aquae]MCS5710845.1 glutathione synthase [Candidatus Berkiella aquae]